MELDYDKVCGRFAVVDGVRVHYGEAGDGPAVLCLHGTGPGANAWINFRHNAGALARDHRTILVDFPRFGRSDKVALPGPRLDVLSTVVRGLMDELGLDLAHLVGNSMGAQVALKLAIDAPDRVGRMVLVAPAPLTNSAFVPMPTETVRMIAGYYTDGGPTLAKMRALLRSLVYDPASVTEEMVRERYDASVEPNVLAANVGSHWAHQSLEHELHRAARPALLVWGQQDRASPLDHALALLQRLPDARLYVFPHCGHSVQLEYPAEFNRLAVDFLTAG